MKHTQNSVLCFVLLLLSVESEAQLSAPRYEFGMNAGAFIYQGDLTPSPVGSFRTPAFVFGVNAARRLSQNFTARFDLNRGSLHGNDAAYSSPEWRKQRAFRFNTPVTELMALLVHYPLGTERRLSPYLFAGLGLALLRIHRDYSGYNAAYFASENLGEGLQQDLAHRLPQSLPVVPLGAGLRYWLSPKLFLTTEASYRYLRSDYLDGFSQAANPALKDHYYKFSAGLGYVAGVRDRLGCPAVKW